MTNDQTSFGLDVDSGVSALTRVSGVSRSVLYIAVVIKNKWVSGWKVADFEIEMLFMVYDDAHACNDFLLISILE